MSTINRIAADCPTPQLVTQTWLIGSNQNPGTAPTSAKLAQGDTSALITKFNLNAARADIAAAYGGGGIGIIWGLGMSVISGITLRVGQGQANIIGVVELTVNTPLVLPDNTADIRIWLQQDGSLNYVVGSNVPPSSHCCFLGFATTSSGAITGTDVSGVTYLRAGGGVFRQTADDAVPGDTLNTSIRVQTTTAGGTYHWDGAAHNQAVNTDQLAFTPLGVTVSDGHLRAPFETHALSAMLQLTSSSANDIRVVSSGDQDVQLPADADAELSMRFRVFNDNLFIGPGHTYINVKNSTGTITLCTLSEKEFCEIIVQWDGTSVTWPITAVVQSQV